MARGKFQGQTPFYTTSRASRYLWYGRNTTITKEIYFVDLIFTFRKLIYKGLRARNSCPMFAMLSGVIKENDFLLYIAVYRSPGVLFRIEVQMQILLLRASYHKKL